MSDPQRTASVVDDHEVQTTTQPPTAPLLGENQFSSKVPFASAKTWSWPSEVASA